MHSRFMNKINQTGTQSCLPIRYKTIMKLSGVQPMMPICQDSKKEIWSNLLKTWNKFLTTCPNSCTQFEYQGKMKLVGWLREWFEISLDGLFVFIWIPRSSSRIFGVWNGWCYWIYWRNTWIVHWIFIPWTAEVLHRNY